MISTILRVILDNKDRGVFTARAVGKEIDSQAESCIVVLHEALERPVGSVGVDVAWAAAMIIRVVQIHEVWQGAQVFLPVDEVGLEHLFEAIKAVKPRGVFRERSIRDMGVVRGKEMIAVVAYDLFHRHVGVLASTRWL